MKITMYELLGMVKDGKASDVTTNFMFERKKYNLLAFLDEYTLDINSLNWEVEILEEEPRDIEVCGSLFTKSEYDKLAHSEEEKKIPEKLNLDTDELRGKETPRAIDYLIESKINQVIDYLKSKRDE